MRKNALPIGVLFMVLVVLLAGIAVSYGYWTETLEAQGTITTGNLNVYWDNPSAVKGGAPGQATCEAWVPGGHDSNLLKVALTNLNPGAQCALSARIRNAGTVPVQVSVGEPAITGANPLLDKYLETDGYIGCENSGVIPAGGSILCSGTIRMIEPGVEENDTQGWSATYDIDVTATQYQYTGS